MRFGDMREIKKCWVLTTPPHGCLRVKPFFSEKGSIRLKISLVDKNEIISDSAEIAEHL